jgi:hypothetical protein
MRYDAVERIFYDAIIFISITNSQGKLPTFQSNNDFNSSNGFFFPESDLVGIAAGAVLR